MNRKRKWETERAKKTEIEKQGVDTTYLTPSLSTKSRYTFLHNKSGTRARIAPLVLLISAQAVLFIFFFLLSPPLPPPLPPEALTFSSASTDRNRFATAVNAFAAATFSFTVVLVPFSGFCFGSCSSSSTSHDGGGNSRCRRSVMRSRAAESSSPRPYSTIKIV